MLGLPQMIRKRRNGQVKIGVSSTYTYKQRGVCVHKLEVHTLRC